MDDKRTCRPRERPAREVSEARREERVKQLPYPQRLLLEAVRNHAVPEGLTASDLREPIKQAGVNLHPHSIDRLLQILVDERHTPAVAQP